MYISNKLNLCAASCVKMKKFSTRIVNWPLWQFIKFCIVGTINTFVNLTVYYLIIFINPELYIISYVIAWVVSVFNAYCLSGRFVFGIAMKEERSLARLGKTYMSYGITLLLTTILLHFEVEVCGISKIVAPIINVIIGIPLNFVLNKFWTFAKYR